MESVPSSLRSSSCLLLRGGELRDQGRLGADKKTSKSICYSGASRCDAFRLAVRPATLDTGRRLLQLDARNGESGWVTGVAMTADGGTLAATHTGGTATVWRITRK